MPKPPQVVIGLGNPLMSDEGVGIRVLHRLEARQPALVGTEFADLGSAGMRVLHAIAGRRKAVLVDCAFMGAAPGTMRRFRPEDVATVKRLAGLSAHEGDLLAILRLSRELGECPEQVVLFGIEPATIAPGTELSAVLAARLDEYAGAVAAELGAAPA